MGPIDNINIKVFVFLFLLTFSACAFDNFVTKFVFGDKDFLMNNKTEGIVKELGEKLDSSKWTFYDERKGARVYVQDGNNRVKLNGSLDATPQAIIKILFDQFENTHKWNLDIEKSQILETFNRTSDIVYQRTKKMFLVNSRNFVFYRHYHTFPDNNIVLAWKAVDSNKMRKMDGVMAIYETSGWRINKVKNEVRSKIEVLVDADLNLGFLSSFARKGFTDGIFQTVEYLRKHLDSLQLNLTEKPEESDFSEPFDTLLGESSTNN